jgi:hypothetical protein
MVPVATVAFPAFPQEEITVFNALCVDHSLDPLMFYVCARRPVMAGNLVSRGLRVVHVEYRPTRKKQTYRCAAKGNWLAAFGRELRDDFYTKEQ